MVCRQPERPRPRRPLRTATPALLLALSASSCSFNPSGFATGDDDGAPPDAGLGPDPDGPPPEPACPEAIHTELSVNGLPAAQGEPVVTVLLGDTVNLSADGSCSRTSGLRFLWTITDPSLAGTISPNDRREEITVYPTLPGEYQVTLTVSDDEGSDEPVTVVAIRAIGWNAFQNNLDVRDLAVGAGRIWIAAQPGPRVVDVAKPGGTPQNVNVIAGGVDTGDNINAVLYAPESNLVWFGRRDTGDLWKVTLGTLTIQSVDLPLAITEVRDISTQGTGILVAGRGGAAVSSDNTTFGLFLPVGDVFAATENQDSGWVADESLFRLNATPPTAFDVFPGNVDRLRALAGDEDRVWVGSDGNGIARFRLQDGQGAADFFTEKDGLPSDTIRSLAIDPNHDLWAATSRGVARYKRDRGVWVAMDEGAGLAGITDLRAIAVSAEDGNLVVVVGDNNGIAVLRVP